MRIEAEKAGNVTEHEADLAIEIRSEGSVMIQLKGDGRKLSAILADFEDAEEIRAEDSRSWAGYGDVIVGYRMDADTVQIRIRRSVAGV